MQMVYCVCKCNRYAEYCVLVEHLFFIFIYFFDLSVFFFVCSFLPLWFHFSPSVTSSSSNLFTRFTDIDTKAFKIRMPNLNSVYGDCFCFACRLITSDSVCVWITEESEREWLYVFSLLSKCFFFCFFFLLFYVCVSPFCCCCCCCSSLRLFSLIRTLSGAFSVQLKLKKKRITCVLQMLSELTIPV